MKARATLLSVILLVTVLAAMTGCGKKAGPGTNTTGTPNPTAGVTATAAPATTEPSATAEPTKSADVTPDAVSSASIVDTEEAFLKAIGKDGTWIICLTKDLSIDKELLMEGEFKNGKKDDAGKEEIQRKLALYDQDDNRNITARYTLTAPKLVVTSPMASIQRGTFKGDLYINVENFELVDATIDGDIYFMTEEAKSTFKMDNTSKITGSTKMAK
ncbi:hypothetical protein HNQ56_003425 [Anaerotaenia torta]|uniref:hypothetical protein n=1 Tax=Anaerotaenia torta TaxID=433293 RepID=UPI003D1CA625